MSSSAFFASMKKLGGIHSTRSISAGASGSSAHKEEGAESTAPEIVIPEPVIENENDVDDVVIADPASKKRKTVSKKDKGKGPVVEKVVVDGEGKSPGGGPFKIGNFTLNELGEFCSSIPSDKEMEEMQKAGLIAVLKRSLAHWAYSGTLISGAATVFSDELNEFRNAKKVDEARIQNLEEGMSTLKVSLEAKISGLEAQILNLKTELEAEKKISLGLMKEKDAAKAELVDAKERAIVEFQGSAAYDQAITDAGAPELLRAWIVAEKLVKTDPNANWDSFFDMFIAAKVAIEEGQGEPVPFSGPNPILFTVDAEPEQTINPGNEAI